MRRHRQRQPRQPERAILDGISPIERMEDTKQTQSTTYVMFKVITPDDSSIVDYSRCTVEFISHYSKMLLLSNVIEEAFHSIVNERDPNMASFHGVGFEDVV